MRENRSLLYFEKTLANSCTMSIVKLFPVTIALMVSTVEIKPINPAIRRVTLPCRTLLCTIIVSDCARAIKRSDCFIGCRRQRRNCSPSYRSITKQYAQKPKPIEEKKTAPKTTTSKQAKTAKTTQKKGPASKSAVIVLGHQSSN